ncbi:MAG: 50S ribosomal protein L9 [Alphaproteobacteria bacterium]|nr:MAG: 50S ribosomal protein L9 [Alphaproteobacteria bacterium]
MELILLERIAKLGQMGDVVQVRDGYARNYLLPQGKALRATRENIARFESQRAQLEARNLETRKEAEAAAERLNGQSFVIIRSAAESGALYGSVNARDVAEAAGEAGFSVERRQVLIERPIKELGLHEVLIQLHPEVTASVTVNVARSPEEAELQASGQTIQDMRAEAEEAAEFEISELFDDLGGAGRDEEDSGPIVDTDSQAEEQPRF